MEEKDILIITEGMGIIIYSDFAVRRIKQGENFLNTHYWAIQDVIKEINSGGIVGVCLENHGEYILKIREGFPSDEQIDNSKFKLRLSLKVEGNKIYIRDLYDLITWDVNCNDSQVVKLENGFYSIYMLGNMPNVGQFGDSQTIYMYFVKEKDFNATNYKGIPDFRDAGKNTKIPEYVYDII